VRLFANHKFWRDRLFSTYKMIMVPQVKVLAGISREDACKYIVVEVCGLELLKEERMLVLIQPNPALMKTLQGIQRRMAAPRL
jgi:hypothetical protein